MVRAGFDPQEMGNFLKLMERYAKLQKKIMRITKRPSELLQTHPNSSKRVNEVINKSNEKIPFNPIIGTEIFLKKLTELFSEINQMRVFLLKIVLFTKN